MKPHLIALSGVSLILLGLGVLIAAAGTTEIVPAVLQVSFGAVCLFVGNKILDTFTT